MTHGWNANNICCINYTQRDLRHPSFCRLSSGVMDNSANLLGPGDRTTIPSHPWRRLFPSYITPRVTKLASLASFSSGRTRSFPAGHQEIHFRCEFPRALKALSCQGHLANRVASLTAHLKGMDVHIGISDGALLWHHPPPASPRGCELWPGDPSHSAEAEAIGLQKSMKKNGFSHCAQSL